MRVTLLGTGAGTGWPNPFCTCVSCQAARRHRDVRGGTSALVDDVLLLDCGQDLPAAAARLGLSLHGVRHLLVTHAHFDHADGSALLARQWAGVTTPLNLVGPSDALARCVEWIEPGGSVLTRPVEAGDDLRLGDYHVRVHAARHGGDWCDQGVLYDLTDGAGARLLYATDTGLLPPATLDALDGAAFDLVCLEETHGDHLDHSGEHLDLATFPTVLADLRRRGAVTDRTRVVAIHLGHGNPPPDELARRLAPWGAEVGHDGMTLLTGQASVPGAGPPRRTLVTGGVRSGKSRWAEAALAAEPAVTYVATAASPGDDAEWQERIALHRARRPSGWRTVETTDLAAALREADGAVLVDDLGNWIARVLDQTGAWDGDAAALSDARKRVAELVGAWRAVRGRAVAVTNEVGSGVVPGSPSGRLFRDELGRLNALLAAESDEVLLVTAGLPQWLRGQPPVRGSHP
ncbi:MAG TPA: bifunctional adenosylcobinamide kinase/adenosylcobinamide-phosphate guanylyltransferase [Cryptosporangiaceae bacterium]|nr:bifunctional adenosylcobinamide kinase/adenosylcobinamide-phosphate guanylyltransferase [Cryptosporangiaceae bacterium]